MKITLKETGVKVRLKITKAFKKLMMSSQLDL